MDDRSLFAEIGKRFPQAHLCRASRTRCWQILLLLDDEISSSILATARVYAVASVQASASRITSISMDGGCNSSPKYRLEFWRLLVEHVFRHPKFGYVHLPEPNPIRAQLRSMGIGDQFIDVLNNSLLNSGKAKLALATWTARSMPQANLRSTPHCCLQSSEH